MTGNLDAFCERCGKTALPPVSVGAAAGGSRMLRRLGFGGRSVSSESTDAAALRLCLGCRGYICSDCWNDDAAVCQTCQPLAGVGVSVQAEMPEEEAPAGLEILDDEQRAEPQSVPLAWPASDLYREPGLADEEPVAAAEPPESEPEIFAGGVYVEELVKEVDEQPAELLAPSTEFAAQAVSSEVPEDPAAIADSFEDRWAEILGRVQAVGTSAPLEPVAQESAPASHAELEPVGAEEAAPTFEVSVLAESDVPESPVELEPVAATTDDEAVEVIEEPVAAADEPVAVAEEPVPAAEEPAFIAAEPVQAVADEPAVSSADTEEDFWAAVLHDADADVHPERPEPDSQELARFLQPRRLRRRVPKPLPRRRPLRLPTQPQPAAAAPSINFAADSPHGPVANPAPEPIAEPAAPVPARSLKLPAALPPRPAAVTQPWPMPAPPAFLPPPPPAISTIQLAPARFRPQNAPVEQAKPPSTRPCGNCGLELSAKVTFCRRCGTRQPLPA
jgi:hypothetical protein